MSLVTAESGLLSPTSSEALGEPWHLGKLYDLYVERLEEFKAAPPEPGWDGVFTATSK